MATLTPEQVAAAAYAGGFRGEALVQAVQVANSESSYDPTNHNACCYGLWQIYLQQHPEFHGDWKNPIDNATFTFELWQKAGGTEANPGAGWCSTGTPGAETCNPWQSYGNKLYTGARAEAVLGVAQLMTDLAAGKTPQQIVGTPGTGSPAGAAQSGFSNPIDTFKNITSAFQHLINPTWWKRVGLGALGLIVVVVGIYFMLPKGGDSFKPLTKIVGNVT